LSDWARRSFLYYFTLTTRTRLRPLGFVPFLLPYVSEAGDFPIVGIP
jgi:hypothetical protein